jgi:hypothetical protein
LGLLLGAFSKFLFNLGCFSKAINLSDFDDFSWSLSFWIPTGLCCGLNCLPTPQIYMSKFLSSNTPECDHVWRLGLSKSN